jgi:hypothetical protein
LRQRVFALTIFVWVVLLLIDILRSPFPPGNVHDNYEASRDFQIFMYEIIVLPFAFAILGFALWLEDLLVPSSTRRARFLSISLLLILLLFWFWLWNFFMYQVFGPLNKYGGYLPESISGGIILVLFFFDRWAQRHLRRSA